MPYRSWFRTSVLMIAFTVLCFAASGCSKPDTPPPAVEQPDIILISIDTLRPDRLHCYGNPRRTSPAIDRLAEQGVQFTQAFSHSPWTLPSHAAMLTGQYPGRFFVSFSVIPQRTLDTLPLGFEIPEEYPSLARVLNEHGYKTVSYNEGGYVGGFGLEHGFDDYESTEWGYAFSRGAEFIRNSQIPYFLFLHTFEPHHPYLRESIFAGSRPDGIANIDWERGALDDQFWGDKAIVRGQPNLFDEWTPTPEQQEYFKTVYDGGVRYADLMVQTIMEALEDRGTLHNTLIVLTSDHGEEFWESVPEYSLGHGHSQHDNLLHVPLVIRFPENQFAGKQINTQVRIADLAPTILDWAGIDPKPLKLAGESLVSMMDTDTAPEPRIAYSGWNHFGQVQYSIRIDGYRYIYTPAPDVLFSPYNNPLPMHALYDLNNDPHAMENIADREPERVDRMHEILLTHFEKDIPYRLFLDQETPAGRATHSHLNTLGLLPYMKQIEKNDIPSFTPMNADRIQQLEALGYL